MAGNFYQDMLLPRCHPPLTVSVALCTCNGERFLREQIRSIALQTLLPQEIVLSDDASCDNGVAVARAALQECLAERAGLVLPLCVLQNTVPLGVT
jgi:hypothetical protein